MKTTLDLPDDLLMEAKMVAVRRRTTLKALVEHALRREVRQSEPELASATDDLVETSEYGLPRLKRREGERVTTEMVRRLMDEEGI